MGIMTLGDLTETTEQELLQQEFRRDLTGGNQRHALFQRAGIGAVRLQLEGRRAELRSSSLSDDERALLDRPIADLNLSVRARKCMVRLGLSTIGELLRRTGDDLLECKNFGVTSLNEVREKLTLNSLKLRGD